MCKNFIQNYAMLKSLSSNFYVIDKDKFLEWSWKIIILNTSETVHRTLFTINANIDPKELEIIPIWDSQMRIFSKFTRNKIQHMYSG